MSVEHVAWAYEQRTGNPTRKLVLLTLAEHCNGETLQCNPSVERLAARTELGESTIRRCLGELVSQGVITRTRPRRSDGSLGTYRYVFPPLSVTAGPPLGASTGPPLGASGQEPEELLEPEVTTADAVVTRARDRQLVRWQVDKVAVTEDEDMLARAVLAEWNVQTGQRLASKSWLSMIVMRVREHPELSIRDHGQLIAGVLADPWWKGAPAPNVVYGNDRVFERSLAPNNTGPKKRPRVYGYGVTPGEILDVTRGKG